MKFYHMLVGMGLFLFFQTLSFSQIDSSRLEFYPLYKGDLWQYFLANEWGGGEYRTATVTTIDTLMPNGHQYARIDGLPYTTSKYFRVDSLLRIMEYLFFPHGRNEANIFRLNEKDSTEYEIDYCITDDRSFPPFIFRDNGIFLTHAFGEVRELMDFQAVNSYEYLRQKHCLLLRGIGVYRVEFSGYNQVAQLTGAIINGRTYGKIVTSVNNHDIRPLGFALDQNYPNPFNATTTMKYTLPDDSHVTISIYDLLGRKVQTVIDDNIQSGQHTLSVDMSAEPSGVYFLRLRTEKQVITQRMVLLK